MQWQVWTAFGIALGDIISVAFGGIEDNIAWRLMLGSTAVAPIIVCVMIYFGPESPRWVGLFVNSCSHTPHFSPSTSVRVATSMRTQPCCA